MTDSVNGETTDAETYRDWLLIDRLSQFGAETHGEYRKITQSLTFDEETLVTWFLYLLTMLQW